MKFSTQTAIVALTASLSLTAMMAHAQTVGADVNVGGTGGATVDADANVGGAGGTTADVNANVGGTGGTNANVNANVGDTANASVTVGGTDGTPPVTSNTDTVAASVNLDVSNLRADAALRLLDVNADGLVNASDDVNGDGVIDSADVEIGIGSVDNADATATINADTDNVAATVNLDVSNLGADAELRALDVNGDGFVNASDDVNGDGIIDGTDVAANTTVASNGDISSALQTLAGLDERSFDATIQTVSAGDITLLEEECKQVALFETVEPDVMSACDAILAR